MRLEKTTLSYSLIKPPISQITLINLLLKEVVEESKFVFKAPVDAKFQAIRHNEVKGE